MTNEERKSAMENLTVILSNRETGFDLESISQQLFVCLMTDDWSHYNSDMMRAYINKKVA